MKREIERAHWSSDAVSSQTDHLTYDGGLRFGNPDAQTKTVKIYEDLGNTGIISDSLFVRNQPTGIENPINTGRTGKFSLGQNYPNPFSTSTTIMYKVTEPGFVLLRVFDVMGTEVATLVNEQKPVGDYSIDWNAERVAGGIYFCRLQAGSFSQTKKLVLQK